MFARQIFQDSKENVKSSMPSKSSVSNSRKGLKSCDLNKFNDSTNIFKNKKAVSEINSCDSKIFLGEKDTTKLEKKDSSKLQEKENFKLKEKDSSKLKVEVEKASHLDDSWSDIEEMHICIESEDDYEDIMPQCDRIQKRDIDSLFLTFSLTKYSEPIVDTLPSPLKEFENLDISDLSPVLHDIEDILHDNSELCDIPLFEV